jgi:hypothetical protein
MDGDSDMIKTTPGTDTIEEDVRTTRHDMEDRMERLGHHSAGDVVDSVLEFARSNGGAIASGIGRTVRDYPMPLAMIGAGIAWIALSSRSDRDDYEDEMGYEYYGSRSREGMTGKLRQRAAEAGEGLRERAADLGERAGELSHKAREQARRAGRGGGRFVRDHPVLIGAAGIAVGAALAAALPRTSREDSVFGERAERARQAAKEAALREGRKVQEAAKAAVEKAREAAEQKGPSAGDFKRDLERTAKAATNSPGGASTGGTGPQTGTS